MSPLSQLGKLRLIGYGNVSRVPALICTESTAHSPLDGFGAVDKTHLSSHPQSTPKAQTPRPQRAPTSLLYNYLLDQLCLGPGQALGSRVGGEGFWEELTLPAFLGSFHPYGGSRGGRPSWAHSLCDTRQVPSVQA